MVSVCVRGFSIGVWTRHNSGSDNNDRLAAVLDREVIHFGWPKLVVFRVA